VLYADYDTIANHLPLFFYVLLYDMPAILQYLCFSLMALYFGKLAISEYTVEQQQRWRTMFNVACALANALLLVTTVWVTWDNYSTDDQGQKHNTVSVVKARVVITETFSLILCLLWSSAVVHLYRLAQQGRLVEGAGVTTRQAMIVTLEIVFLLATRFVYNMAAISYTTIPEWGFRISFFADRYHFKSSSSDDDPWAYVLSVGSMFLWEIVPVFLVISFFNVPKVNYEIIPDEQRAVNGGGPVWFEDEQDSDSDSELQGQGTINDPGRTRMHPKDSMYDFWPDRDMMSGSRNSYYDSPKRTPNSGPNLAPKMGRSPGRHGRT